MGLDYFTEYLSDAPFTCKTLLLNFLSQCSVPEFFWLVTGLPSVGIVCWKTCTVSWTVCRCRHTSNGSMQVETFWASRYRGSERKRLIKADVFSWLRPGQQTRTQTQNKSSQFTDQNGHHCMSHRTSPGPPTPYQFPRWHNSAYTFTAGWKEQVSLHPSSPPSTGEPLRACWPDASMSGMGTVVQQTARPSSGQWTPSVPFSPSSWIFSLHDAPAKPIVSWMTPPILPVSSSSYHQEDGTRASEPTPPDCSTAFSPRLWEPWTQNHPAIYFFIYHPSFCTCTVFARHFHSLYFFSLCIGNHFYI